MKRVQAWWRGIAEHRYDVTTSYDYPLIEWYDRGRALARRICGGE